MRDALERLPDPELEIMIILWEAREPVALSYISQKLRAKRNTKLLSFGPFWTGLQKKAM